MLVSIDASQLEWRTIAELARDQTAIGEIVSGADTHTLNQEAFRLPSRLIAKIYLFRTIYRGSGFAFSVDPAFMHVSTDPKFWDNIGVQFYRKYHGIDTIHQQWAGMVTRGEPIVGPFGRVWDIPLKRDYRGDIKIPWTTLTNYPVQGTGADVMMVARISLWRRLCQNPRLHGQVQLISTVHDSITIDCPSDLVVDVVRLMYEVFDDLVVNIRRTFKYDWITPLAGEVKIGMDMLNQKKVDRDAKYV